MKKLILLSFCMMCSLMLFSQMSLKVDDNGNDNSATFGSGFAVIGGGLKALGLDDNGIQTYNAIVGGTSTLYLNYYGGNIDLLGLLNSAGNLQVDGNGIYYNNANDRTGFGTNSLAGKISVNGSGNSTGVYISGHSTYGIRAVGGTIGMYSANQTGDGLYVQNSGNDGVHIENAAQHGLEVDGGVTAVYVHDQANQGVYSFNTGLEAGVFINTAASARPALSAGHGDDTKYDLELRGHARVQTDGKYTIQLDENDNAANEYWTVKSSPAQGSAFVMYVYEDGHGGVTGNFSKGGGSFKIDHPLDPENKYLYHSFVESPDMMNVYNGNVKLDESGEAMVSMEDWFEVLNRDYRYQLTSIGAPGPNLYIAKKIENGSFKIAGGQPGAEVSWQVTGIRQDPWAEENRIEVEVEKESFNKGKYLHPEAWSLRRGGGQLERVTLLDPNADNSDPDYEKAAMEEFARHKEQVKQERENRSKEEASIKTPIETFLRSQDDKTEIQQR